MPHFRPLTVLGNQLTSVQSILAFESWKGYPQFEDDKGLGRAALLACILATIFGVNLVLCLQLLLIHLGLLPKEIFGDWPDGTLQMAMQWTVYVILLCAFHLLEFFTTAIFNPSVTSADSFMVCTVCVCRAVLSQRNYELIYAIDFLGKSFEGLHCSSIDIMD